MGWDEEQRARRREEEGDEGERRDLFSIWSVLFRVGWLGLWDVAHDRSRAIFFEKYIAI